jgi:class 3 adenylate cyclase/alpha-beta hydrolase superfamily lysophospholipase
MLEFPETQYAECDGLSIAFQIWGDAPHDLVAVPGVISHLEAYLEVPEYVRFFRTLSTYFRVVIFDKRGGGMSDRISGAPTLDERVRDISAVMEAAGVKRPVLFSNSDGASMSMLFAAQNPNRASKLIVGGGYAAGRLARGDHSLEDHKAFLAELRETWGKPSRENYFTRMTQHRDDPGLMASMARVHRMCATPTSIVALMDMNARIDVRDLLSTIQQPTLVLRRAEELLPRDACKYVADHIPNALYRELPGNEHPAFLGDTDAYVDAIREFSLDDVTHVPPPSTSHRVLATVLFTDIVGSTEQQVRLGDYDYRMLMNRHDEISLRQIERFNGRFIHSTGDGLLATFAAPTDAINCAAAIRGAVSSIDLAIRAGVHTGEIELRGDDISGISVNIASRIAEQAGESEILASDLTRQLMIGSNASFAERGEFKLKGVPGPWPLFAASLQKG